MTPSKIHLCLIGIVLLVASAAISFAADPSDTTYVRFNTNLGNIDVQLFSHETPNTVANFLTYVDGIQNNPAYTYNNSLIHRSIPGFIIQGGGFAVPNGALPITAIPTPANPLLSEYGISNTRGTIAMALTSAGKDSASNNWFFNLVANTFLDNSSDGGPFTVFGTVANSGSLAVMDLIAAQPTYDASTLYTQLYGSSIGPAFTNVPLINYVSGTPTVQNLVVINSVTRLTVQTFATWQSAKFTPTQQANASFISPTATPFNDGVPNLLKYLFDINPSAPMTAHDRSLLPKVGMTPVNGTNVATLTFREYAQKIDASFTVQTSSDLVAWSSVSHPTIVQMSTDSTNSGSGPADPVVQVQVPASGTKQFLRLQVTQP
jgi:peptidyl-prolyl cis-trans isomerase A (cyclophilin A)